MLKIHFAEFAFVVSALFLVTGVHSQDCGQSGTTNFGPRIAVSELNATEGAWPWMVAITKKNSSGIYSPWCTGFLIDRRHVISAAQCFDKKEYGLYSTRIGSLNQNQGEEYPISNIVVPVGWKKYSLPDDMAILTLTREVDSPNFNPICLPDAEVESRKLEGIGTTAVGWEFIEPGQPKSIALKQLNAIPVVSNQYCDKVFGNTSDYGHDFPQGLPDEFICAGIAVGQREICQGYLGGPLMLEDRNRWFAVGVGNSGYCDQVGFPKGYPSLYTRVSAHLKWIRENTMYRKSITDVDDNENV